MLPTERLHLFAGVVLLLLAAALIVNAIMMFTITDSDVFDRDEIDNVLVDIKDHHGAYVVSEVAGILVDGALGIAAAASLYMVFRERNRRLALLGLAFLLVASAAFLAADAAGFVMGDLASDFKEGGAGGIAAGDRNILEVARAVGIFQGVAGQLGFTALSLGILSLGLLIGWAPEARAVPPRALGWVATFAGVVGIFAWLVVVADAAFVLFIIAGLAQLIFLIGLGLWLLRTPEESVAMEPARIGA